MEFVVFDNERDGDKEILNLRLCLIRVFRYSKNKNMIKN